VSRLAIVISAVGDAELLEATLVSVLENRPADCQIIVALSQPYADPYDLKDEVRFVQSRAGAGPIEALNRALAATRAPLVHLLASGCRVTEGWADEALQRFGDRQVACVAPLVYEADRPDRILAAGVGYRASGKRFLVGRGLSDLPGDAQHRIIGPCGFAAFYRKAALDFIGGPSSQLGRRSADVDLALMFKRAGFSAALATRSRILAPAQVEIGEGPFRDALCDERLFWRNLPQRGQLKSLAAHAGNVALELLVSLPRPRAATQLAARTLACLQFGGYVRHRWALAQLAQRAIKPKLPEQVRIDDSHPVASGRNDSRHDALARAHSR
jgi:hypothetical protein